MNLTALFEQLKRGLLVAKAANLDIDLSYTMFMVLMGLLKKISIHLQVDMTVLTTELKTKPTDLISRINELIFNEFDYDTREYGLMSQEIFKVLAEVLKTTKPIEQIQVMELLEKLNDIGLKVESQGNEDFLDTPDMTPANNPEK